MSGQLTPETGIFVFELHIKLHIVLMKKITLDCITNNVMYSVDKNRLTGTVIYEL